MNVVNVRTLAGLRDLASLRSSRESEFSLRTALNSYSQYSHLSHEELAIRRTSYNSLGRAHRRLGNKIGYAKKLDDLSEAIALSAVITEKIANLAKVEFCISLPSYGSNGDLWRVREVLKHFVRDWSAEGAPERGRIFQPILDVLREVDLERRSAMRILVPGSGLGRLAWEISQLGYNTTANELSFFMNLAFRFLLSPTTTSSLNQHTLHPYADWFSHQRTKASNFRPISFPDAIPRLTSNFHLAETDFLTLPPLSSRSDPTTETLIWSRSKSPRGAGYDYIVTLFFIDTSINILTTMEHIHTLLRPGGIWINLGPLLWTAGGKAKLELSLDEVLRAAEEIGFVFEAEDPERGEMKARRTVECQYTADVGAMMQWIYKAEFWVARKPE